MTEPGTPPVIGVIGGSGVYEIEGMTNTEWRQVVSPFGMPSDELLFGELDGQQIVFLPRHGRGHQVPPSGLNFRANIDAMKRAGVTEIISISAVGSLKKNTRRAISSWSISSSTARLHARKHSLKKDASPTCLWPIRCAADLATISPQRCRIPVSNILAVEPTW